MLEYKKFVGRIGLIGLTNLLVSLNAVILIPIITKNFTISEYGVWVQIGVTISLMGYLATLGLPYTMVRFLAAEKNKEKILEGIYTIIFIVIFSTIIISLLLFLFSGFLSSIIFNNYIEVALILPIIIFFTSLNNVLLNYFRTFQQIKLFSLFTLLQNYLNLIIVAYLVLTSHTIIGATIGMLISQIIVFIVILLVILHEIGFKIPRFSNAKQYLSFALPTVPSNLSHWIVDSSDRYIIGILLSAAFVGYYSPAYTLGNMLIMYSTPLAAILPAVLSKYYDANDIKEVQKHLKYSLKYYFALCIPSVFGISLLSQPILILLTTPDIASNGYLVTPFVAVTALIYGINIHLTQIVVLKKKTKILFWAWMLAALLNIILNILFIPLLGIIGAAAMTLLAYLTTFIVLAKYSLKYLTLDFNIKFVTKSILASLAFSLVIILLKPQGIINILLVISVCALIYMIILLALKGFNKEEVRFIKQLIGV